MKLIKLILVVALTGITFSLMAQQNGGRRQFSAEDMAKRQTESMKKELTLTTEQEIKVQAINLKFAEKQAEQMKNRDFRSMTEEQRKEVEKKRKDTDKLRVDEIKKVITNEQFKKYEKVLEESEKRRTERRNNR